MAHSTAGLLLSYGTARSTLIRTISLGDGSAFQAAQLVNMSPFRDGLSASSR